MENGLGSRPFSASKKVDDISKHDLDPKHDPKRDPNLDSRHDPRQKPEHGPKPLGDQSG
jgi:hypothetical protein